MSSLSVLKNWECTDTQSLGAVSFILSFRLQIINQNMFRNC